MRTRPVLGAVLLAIPLLPAAAGALLGGVSLLGPRLDDRGERGVEALVGGALSLAAIGSLAAAAVFLADPQPSLAIHLGAWFGSGDYRFDMAFLLDRLSASMLVLTSVIVGTIARFSFRYLHREPGFLRFFILLCLFASGMLLLVEAGSADLLAAGWELVGLTSALLIGFFHERPGPVRGALRAYLTYRACDVGLLVGVVLLHQLAGTSDFHALFGPARWPPAAAATVAPSSATLIACAFTLAAMGKSALFPVGGWLPRAMEGPTPSSALFYGALSVHAGVYLLLRLAPLFERSPAASGALVALGLLTALYGNVVGRVQSDVKSALAFASMTQVGLMVAEVGMGWSTLCLLHLVGHASLRGLQFLRAPSALEDALRIRHANDGRTLAPVATLTRLLVPRTMRKLYWHAHARLHLDAALERLLVGPFLALAHALDALDRRLAGALGVPHRAPADVDLAPRGSTDERRVAP